MKPKFCLILFMSIVLGASYIILGQEDVAGSKDHPLFTRMDNYYISGYEESEYDTHEFYDAQDNEYIIEGHKWVIEYTLKEGFESPGQLKVRNNHIAVIKKIGGTILFDRGTYMKFEQGGKEVWIDLWVSSSGSDYRLTLVEKTVMEQEVTADPKALADDLKNKGHAAVYGIYFDTDSAVIKAESKPALKAIADMLQTNSSLKVFVVGHTDMTGTLEHNMDLSKRRADSVVQELTKTYGISSNRLKAMGAGPLCPVGTNKTEEGRKLNRRVELVEM
ncbi:MAG: OmpA family protein [Candidatus Aminicenantes bacterium]|nr:OmpA family protein [Candidatus Aminicenantes bacterium]